jgi:hypothetical protein
MVGQSQVGCAATAVCAAWQRPLSRGTPISLRGLALSIFGVRAREQNSESRKEA